MIKLEAKNWTVQGDLMVSFYKAGTIADDVWQDYCDTIGSAACRKVMATSIGAIEVSSSQRKLVSDVLKQSGVSVAVVTDEAIVRGLMTAVSWLGRVDLRAFPWHKVADAYLHLAPQGITQKEALDLVDAIRRRVESEGSGTMGGRPG
ncbi:STAS/SEC14 domain-containing protein [Nannocystaceae bacterium ST9]